MKKPFLNLIAFLALCLPGCLMAQQQEWLWAKSAQNSANSNVHTICTDVNGNVYSGGIFASGPLTFGDHTVTGTGMGSSLFIVKHTPEGNAAWLQKASGLQCYLSSIAVDADGNLFGAGYFNQHIQLGEIPLTSTSTWSMFIFMIDSTGAFSWAKKVGDSDRVHPSQITVDANGNLCVAGYFTCPTVTFENTNLSLEGAQDIFIAKYDSHGDLLWAKKGGNSGMDQASSITTDPQGNIYIAGQFSSSITFGNTTFNSSGFSDSFIAKYDADGNVLWAQKAGSSDWDTGYGVTVDGQNNVIYAGSYHADITLGNIELEHTSPGSGDIYIAKYDSEGSLVWARSITGDDHESLTPVVSDDQDNLYITGQSTSAELDLNGVTLANSTGQRRIFVAKLDNAGNAAWAVAAGNNGDNLSRGLALDGQDNIYIGGSYTQFIQFGNTTLNATGLTAFVAKYGLTTMGTNNPETNAFVLYPNPATHTLHLRTPAIADNTDYTIYDVTGKKTLSGTAANGSIDVSGLQNGLYVLNAGGITAKFVKE